MSTRAVSVHARGATIGSICFNLIWYGLMPELPDVERFERVLAKNALRKRIERVIVSDARILGKRSIRAFVQCPQGRA